MRKSAFFKTVIEFGGVLSPQAIGSLRPSLYIQDSEVCYRRLRGRSCIEQEFKGFLGYLQYYEISVDTDVVIPLEVRQRDIYGIYSLRSRGELYLCQQQGERITNFRDRRALYMYLDPGEYDLHLSAGKYQFLCYYFDIGIFDGGADGSFEFLKDLLVAHRQSIRGPIVTLDFKIGPVTEAMIQLLFANLKKGDLDSQIFIIHMMKELIKLARKKIDDEQNGTSNREVIANAAVLLMDLFTEREGIKCKLELIADKLAITSNYLQQIFKSEKGIGPSQYIHSLVLAMAKKQLDEGQAIRQTGENCGFADLSGFYKFFRREAGMTPKEYQNRSSFHKTTINSQDSDN